MGVATMSDGFTWLMRQMAKFKENNFVKAVINVKTKAQSVRPDLPDIDTSDDEEP
jgi:hypothetical protein